ncbi:MAG: shikimate kinase [Vicinamibacterales bacterium]
MVIVLVGPAGAGKTTVGTALAAQLGWTFIEAANHLSPAALLDLSAGRRLTDDERAGWLTRVHAFVARAIDRREPLVLACPALTALDRSHIANGLKPVRFVYLKSNRDALVARLPHGPHRVGREQQLDDQLAVLEAPTPDHALTLDATADVDTLIGHIRLEFGV